MAVYTQLEKTKKWVLGLLGFKVANNTLASSVKILTVNNSTVYTPTQDYHPATKKYVDDTVGNIATVLENI